MADYLKKNEKLDIESFFDEFIIPLIPDKIIKKYYSINDESEKRIINSQKLNRFIDAKNGKNVNGWVKSEVLKNQEISATYLYLIDGVERYTFGISYCPRTCVYEQYFIFSSLNDNCYLTYYNSGEGEVSTITHKQILCEHKDIDSDFFNGESDIGYYLEEISTQELLEICDYSMKIFIIQNIDKFN